MKRITLIISTIIAVVLTSIPALAQWTTFHGDARRSGLSPHNGPAAPTLAWARDVGGAIVSSPILAGDGTIYLGSVVRDTLKCTYSIVATNPDGTPKWSFPTGFVDTQTLSSPAIGPTGRLYVGAQDHTFYALDPNGSLAWSYAATGPVIQHPVVAPNGTVYVGIDGDLHAFSANGTLLWRVGGGELGFPGGPSLAADGTIYVAGGTQGVASKLFAFNPNGSARWVFQFDNPYFFCLAPPTVAPDGTIYAHTQALYAVNPTGTLKWVRELSFGAASYGSAAVDTAGNVVYAADYKVWKVSPQGTILWTHLINTGCGGFLGHTLSAPLIDASGRVYLGLGDGKRSAVGCEKKLLVLSPSGALVSSFTFPEIPGTSSPALAADGTLYIGCLDGMLYALR